MIVQRVLITNDLMSCTTAIVTFRTQFFRALPSSSLSWRFEVLYYTVSTHGDIQNVYLFLQFFKTFLKCLMTATVSFRMPFVCRALLHNFAQLREDAKVYPQHWCASSYRDASPQGRVMRQHTSVLCS